MKNLQFQPNKKQSLKKHRRIKSQQFMGTQLNHQTSSNKTSYHYPCSTFNTNKNNQNIYVVEVIKKDRNNIKFIFENETLLKIVKENICKKLELEKKKIYFQTTDQDYNFDYEFEEQIGVLNSNKKLTYSYIQQQFVDCLDKNKQNKQNQQNQQSSKINSYFIYQCLSVGGFSKVFLIRSKKSGKFYAAKFIHKNLDQSPKFRQLIYNQKFINQILEYPMLVKMHQFIETNSFFIFILDYCPSGQLFSLMKNHRDMTENQAKFYFLETILAIQYMHSKSIVYRDIKPQNILLDKNGHIKIADFGLSRIMRERSTSYCGSLQYMAPQIVLGNQHSFGVDHYCLGSLLFQLMVGCPPFYNPNFTPSQTKYHIVNSQVKFPPKRYFSPQYVDFVSKLLDKNPKTRLGSLGGIKQILSHPWVGKFDRQKYQTYQITPPFILNLNKSNFQTTYLPKQSIRQTKNRILADIQQEQLKRKGFKKQNKISDQFSDKLIKKINHQEDQSAPKRSIPKRKISKANSLYIKEERILNPYELFLSNNKSMKKISKSLLKNQSKSLHMGTEVEKNRSQSKINKIFCNIKCFAGKLPKKYMGNQYKTQQNRKQIQKFRKSTQSIEQLKRKNNKKTINGNENKQNMGQLNNFKLKYQNSKEKNVRKMIGDYLRYTCTDDMENFDKKTNKIWKFNKPIVNAFGRNN